MMDDKKWLPVMKMWRITKKMMKKIESVTMYYYRHDYENLKMYVLIFYEY